MLGLPVEGRPGPNEDNADGGERFNLSRPQAHMYKAVIMLTVSITITLIDYWYVVIYHQNLISLITKDANPEQEWLW